MNQFLCLLLPAFGLNGHVNSSSAQCQASVYGRARNRTNCCCRSRNKANLERVHRKRCGWNHLPARGLCAHCLELSKRIETHSGSGESTTLVAASRALSHWNGESLTIGTWPSIPSLPVTTLAVSLSVLLQATATSYNGSWKSSVG